MKKWLIGCLTVLAMVCLIPGIALNAKAESLYCRNCDKFTDCEILGYKKYDSSFHTLHIKCKSCKMENDVIDSNYSSHEWSKWETLSGMILHGHSCNRCGYYITEVCTGGTATCTAKAVCVVCGGEYGKLAQHPLVTIDRPATCQKEGLRYTYCTACRYRTPDIITPIQPHVLKKAREFTREPTCTKRGWKSYYSCTTCTTYSETDWVEKLGHDFVHHDAQAPTCTGIGWDAYDTCSRCNYTTRKELPALNHDLVQHDAQAPTCTEKGWAYETCSRSGCNYITRKELPALNHALVQHEAKTPTCTEPGWNAYDTCKNCDYTTYTEQPALNHAFVYHQAKPATCKEIGWDAYKTCSRCDYTNYVELPALKNHDLRQYVTKAPTCTEIGFAYVRCWLCDYSTSQVLPALNHDLKQYAAKAPTCTEKGWNAYETCSRSGCNYTTYVELPAQHDLMQHAAKAPTCTEPGWDAYDTCSRCDYNTYAEVPALNHALVQHEAKAPTCTEKGWNAYETCSRCNYTTYVELPALNHDYQAVTVDPTCEADGYTVFTCSRCKDSYTADPTDKLGHQFGAWSPNGTGSQSAGCLRQGCVHIGSTACRKFTFRTAEGGTLTFCPACGQVENAAQMEKLDDATAWALSGSLSAADVTARTNGEYLSVAFETAGSLTQPTGLVRLALPAGLLEGKKLVRIAPDGTQTEMPFETKNGKLLYTLDFAESELPVMLFRLVPQTTTL